AAQRSAGPANALLCAARSTRGSEERLNESRGHLQLLQRILGGLADFLERVPGQDRKSTRLNSSHLVISYAVFCLKKKKNIQTSQPRIPEFDDPLTPRPLMTIPGTPTDPNAHLGPLVAMLALRVPPPARSDDSSWS